MNKNNITIIGNGNIGQAIFYLLNKEKNVINVYDKKDTEGEHKLDEYIKKSNFVFLCIPSWATDGALKEIRPYLNKETILISLAKGICEKNTENINSLIEKNINKAKYALLSGPMFATEIKNNKMAFAILATKDKKVYEKTKELFKNSKLKLTYSKDVSSVAMAAVLKNIYALLIGIIENCGDGDNTKGYLAYQSIKEMQGIMKKLKLNDKIILEIAGIGDFIATSSSIHSQNMKAGKEIFSNGNASIKSEGLVSLKPLLKKIGKNYKQFLLLSLLEKILLKKKDPKKEIESFFNTI